MNGTVLDLEWDGNDPDQQLLVLGLGHTAYPWDSIPQYVSAQIADANPKIVFTKADHEWLAAHDMFCGGPIYDVQTMCYVYDERTPLSLDWCVKHYLGYDPDKRIRRQNGKVMFQCDDGELVLMADAPADQLLRYNERDLLNTLKLANEMERRLKADGSWDYWERSVMPFSRVLLKMETNGLPIDVTAAMELGAELDDRVEVMNVVLHKDLPAEFNPRSKDQVAEYLFTKGWELTGRIRMTPEDKEIALAGGWPEGWDTSFVPTKIAREYVHGFYEMPGLGLKPKVKAPKCAKKECSHAPGDCLPSVSAKTLSVHHGDNPWVADFLDFKTYDKALQYVDKWMTVQRNGRLHTHFKQTGTETGRLSSADPINLQNIPSRGTLGHRIRALFKAPPGCYLVDGDFSQIEPRLMAHFSGDPELTRVFTEGLDLYEEAMLAVLGKQYPQDSPERQLVKTCFLALGYGAGPPKLRATLAEQGFRFSLQRVANTHQALTELYKGFWAWKDEVIAEAQSKGYVETIGGHRRHFDFGYQDRWRIERQVVNSKIQGSAADICQETMLYCDKWLPDKWKLVCQVHDEIIYEVPEAWIGSHWVHMFEDAGVSGHGFKLDVPLVFKPKVVTTWAEAK